ncbi:MAG: PqqD family protein [Bacteroidaceae bacterium]|nr:PqqD family protein [Bacteroidaceae bacterium]
MRIKKGFDLQDVCGYNVIVATGLENIDFSKIVNLNESAAVIWKAVAGRDFTLADMVKALTDEYEVSAGQAEADVRATLAKWREIGLVED